MRYPVQVITRAPLRISFVGGGSDLPGGDGAVIAGAINKYVYCCARWRNDSDVYVTWREKEIRKQAHEVQHGIIRESLLHFGIFNGIEILTWADVPGVGSGLGSSAATANAIILALGKLKLNEIIPLEELWKLSCLIELKKLGGKGGKQDQIITAEGGISRINFFEKGDILNIILDFNDFQFKDLSEHFLLFSPRNKEGRDSQKILGGFKDSTEFRKACITLVELFLDSLPYSERPNIIKPDVDIASSFSYLMHHHELKRDYFPGYISDEWNEWFISIAKVGIHAKLCGAGDTGHLLVGARPSNHGCVIKTVEEVWGPRLEYEFTRQGAEVLHAC